MFEINWGDLTPELFLKNYWQKKPLLLKGALTNFVDPIEADELAGLAMEEQIQSRIIAGPKNGEWQVEHGPFSSFESFGDTHWTLLVQAVNNWSQPTDELLACFKFIPAWRLDDVMVSFSTPSGGVGPHLDQYDVFIAQGMGKRHWQVGAPDSSLETLIPHPDLKQVSQFTAVIDVVTEPGDLLYIPPNHPHNGVAIENSLNYSIGFQAPSGQELWSGFADKMLDQDLGKFRFPDPDREATQQPHKISQHDISAIKNFMLQELANEETFTDYIGEQLTQCQHALELLPPDETIHEDELIALIENEDIQLTPVLGIKALLTDAPTAKLFICGEKIGFDETTCDLAVVLSKKQVISAALLKNSMSHLKNISLLTKVLNKGYWYID